MKEINIDEKLAGQKMMRCLERYLSNAPKSFLYKMLRKKNILVFQLLCAITILLTELFVDMLENIFKIRMTLL